MEEIHDVFKEAGGKMVGYWPTEGYQHEESKVVQTPWNKQVMPSSLNRLVNRALSSERAKAVELQSNVYLLQALVDDATFCGLPLDEDNEDDKTLERVKAWVGQLKGEMSL